MCDMPLSHPKAGGPHSRPTARDTQWGPSLLSAVTS